MIEEEAKAMERKYNEQLVNYWVKAELMVSGSWKVTII